MDTNGIERLVILPFTGYREWQQIARDLTGIFRDKIGGTGKFQQVDAAVYKPNADAADAVFTGEVTRFIVQDSSRQLERKTKDGETVQFTVYDRVVSLEFTYRLIRDRDGTLIGERRISCTAENRGAENRASLPSGVDMAKQAAQNKLYDFTKEIVPWTSTEKLVLDKETSRDRTLKGRMKEAEALVKAGSYKAAQDAYAGIYAETKSLAAGYNQAILAQPLDGLEAAVSLMSNLVNATGYNKARAELDRLRWFIGENAAAAANQTGVSQQQIAIRKVSQGLIAALPAGSRISLFHISKSEIDRTDVVIREITPLLMNSSITVLERENAALLDAEKQFQSSGEVSDDSYVSIGQMLGVEIIVTFSITGSGHLRKLTVKSVSVETGQILYSESTDM
jgi:hypothetical protein